MSEVLLALKEARETLNRLLSQYPNTGITTRRFELNKDLKHIQDQITILENFISHPIETMTYKTNNLTVKYPRYEEVSTWKLN